MTEGRLHINMIQCSIASSGVSHVGTQAFGGVCSVVFGAIGAAAGAALGVTGTVVTFGVAVPLAVALPALAGATTAAVSEAIVQGGIAGATSIGHKLADNLYVTVNTDTNKVWPPNAKYYDILAGQTLRTINDMPGHHDVVLYEGDTRKAVATPGVPIYSGTPGGDTATVKLWDYDAVGDDDMLATFAVSLKSPLAQTAYVYANSDEESLYIVELAVT